MSLALSAWAGGEGAAPSLSVKETLRRGGLSQTSGLLTSVCGLTGGSLEVDPARSSLALVPPRPFLPSVCSAGGLGSVTASCRGPPSSAAARSLGLWSRGERRVPEPGLESGASKLRACKLNAEGGRPSRGREDPSPNSWRCSSLGVKGRRVHRVRSDCRASCTISALVLATGPGPAPAPAR